MTRPTESDDGRFETAVSDDGGMIVRFNGRLDVTTAGPILRALRPRIRRTAPRHLTADLGDVDYLDDYGALLIFELKEMLPPGEARFETVRTSESVAEALDRIDLEPAVHCAPPRRRHSYETVLRIGESTLTELNSLRFMIAFLGSVVLALGHVIRHPKSLRVDDTLIHMEKTGVDALPVVALISFLLGLIMAFMSSMQFRQFGADIYVASLVAFAMFSELGPIMTAIIVAGRSGSAYAAEIGTMKISEEIDALYTMGFDPTRFLAVPRLLAAVLVVPLLTLFANLFAVAGGLTVGVFMLGLSTNTYIKQTVEALTLTEVAWGTAKSAVFAALIACTGCLRGFQARGGASAVGTAATSAVVTSIFLIILFDSVFAVIRSYWG